MDRERVKELHKAGKSIWTIAAEMNLNRQTLQHRDRELIETFLAMGANGRCRRNAPRKPKSLAKRGPKPSCSDETLNHPGLSCQRREGSTVPVVLTRGVMVPVSL